MKKLPAKILVSPLDWGLGHATRCIPIIETFIENGTEVLIAGNGNSLELLKKEFPNDIIEDIALFECKFKFQNFFPYSCYLI